MSGKRTTRRSTAQGSQENALWENEGSFPTVNIVVLTVLRVCMVFRLRGSAKLALGAVAKVIHLGYTTISPGFAGSWKHPLSEFA